MLSKLRSKLREFDRPVFFVLALSMAVIPVLFLFSALLGYVNLPGAITLANGGRS